MSKIKIRNFGPIKDGLQSNDGWLDIEKVTVFIGNQGSGKSVIAKLISTFTWIEKALVRGDYNIQWFETRNKLKNQYLTYHRLEHYLNPTDGKDQAEIDYQGDAYFIRYKDERLSIRENLQSNYPLPQIMYVPAERNFISYVKSPRELKLASGSSKEFLTEYENAKNNLEAANALPINNVDIEYDKLNDIVNVKGKDYKIELSEASSGFQSLVPLYLVSYFLAHSVRKQSRNTKDSMTSEELNRFKNGVQDIWSNDQLTDEQKRAALSVLSSKFNKSAFINIIEEPEQNLFPDSQWKMLLSLLELNNLNEINKLIMTTHSPYLINNFSVIVKANQLKSKIQNKKDLSEKTNAIVPLTSTINPDNLRVYEVDDKNGSINILDDYNGLPSDENYLNLGLAEANDLFAKLLDIEVLCQ